MRFMLGHRSFTMFDDRQHSSGGDAANRPQSIRPKIGARRAPMRRQGANREKFFCCQNHDSESVRLTSQLTFEPVALLSAQQSSITRITKTTTAIVFPAIQRIWSRHRAGFFRNDARMSSRLFDRRASRALDPRRQYFLKREAVFFTVLVYSGWSASRFPSARSD
jgi:hypothetical protein